MSLSNSSPCSQIDPHKEHLCLCIATPQSERPGPSEQQRSLWPAYPNLCPWANSWIAWIAHMPSSSGKWMSKLTEPLGVHFSKDPCCRLILATGIATLSVLFGPKVSGHGRIRHAKT